MPAYHYLLQQTYTRWSELEQAIEPLPSAQEKGEVFEQFVYLYLKLRSDYYQIDKLYRAKDIPAKLREQLHLEITDYGVDGVFVLTDGTIAAYQAKFRSNRGTATVRELATFWAEAARADHKYVIANATTLPPQAGKHSSSILADTFDDLDADFLAALQTLATTTKQPVFTKATPDAHQTRMIKKTVQGFKTHDRGKLIAACGAGKTLTSLWIIEQLEAKTVLVLAPSLALIKQTLEAWAAHKNQQFSYLCVCSDQSVVDAKELDYGEYEVSEVDFPVTTDPAMIQKFLQSSAERKYIFSTYQSTAAVAEAAHDNAFDLTIFDEAHRTAGKKDGSVYSLALNDEHITAKKRLFMTATERLVQPWIIDRAAEEDRVVFSMDDSRVYGELFDRYTFGEAIQDGVIADYKILLTAVTASEVEGLIQDNRLLVAKGNTDERLLTAENIYKQVVLYKAMQHYVITKAITFHSSVKRAKAFVNGSGNESLSLDDLYPTIWLDIADKERYFDYVDGSMPAGLRKQKLREFERSQLGILSNARCLTEGIDVPVIDSVYFVDPKTSLVDIVQACGRALRKSRNDTTAKTAYFIVPVILGDTDTVETPEQSKFEMLLKLVQALRGQDERMADWIDTINLGHVKGRKGGGGSSDSPVVIDFPKQFDLTKFAEEIQIRIYEGVSGPPIARTDKAFTIRKSNYRKVFKGLGDLGYQTYVDSLIDPTIQKFKSPDQIVPAEELKIVNNNLSHTLRAGLIKQVNKQNYQLTIIGKKYQAGTTDIKEVFKQAMLRYNCRDAGEPLLPYVATLEILSRVGSINKVEFLYGVYSLQDSSSASIEAAVDRITKIRQSYPNIRAVIDANKSKVLKELNTTFEESFSEADIWASTTATNKFLYFKNHLELFDGVTATSTHISLSPEAVSEVSGLADSVKAGMLEIL